MAVAKKTKEKVHKNRTKEGLRTGVRTSGKTNSPPGWPSLYRAGSGEEKKHRKRGAKIGLRAFLFFSSFGSAHPHTSRIYFPLLSK